MAISISNTSLRPNHPSINPPWRLCPPRPLLADDADTDPRVADAVRALNIRYVITSKPVGRGFAMPDGLVSLDKSASWAKIYENGESRIYEWRGR